MLAFLSYCNERVASSEIQAESGLGGRIERLLWDEGFDLGR